MNKQDYIEWITGLYENNAKIGGLNIAYFRPDEWPHFHKGLRKIAHIMCRRDAVMDQIVEGEHVLCPALREEEFSKENVEAFLNNSNAIFDITLFFHRCERNEHEDGVGFLAIERLK